MMMRFLWMTILVAVQAFGQTYQPTEANLKAREWFQNARFGMFIHWGVYSVLGDGEWVMNNHKMTVAEYEKLAPQFNPTEFDAGRMGGAGESGGHEIHHHHQQASRWLRHVGHEAEPLEHCRRNAL